MRRPVTELYPKRSMSHSADAFEGGAVLPHFYITGQVADCLHWTCFIQYSPNVLV